MIGSVTVCYFKIPIAAKPAITASSASVPPRHPKKDLRDSSDQRRTPSKWRVFESPT